MAREWTQVDNDRVTISHHSSLSISNDGMYMVWIKTDDTNQEDYVVDKFYDGVDDYALVIRTDATIDAVLRAGGANKITNGTTIDTSWNNYLVEINDTDDDMHLWKNGSDDTSVSLGGSSPDTGTDDIWIGDIKLAGFDRACDGHICYFILWNVILTSNEIGAMSRGVNPFVIRHASQQCHLPLWGNDSTEPDYTGNSRTGAVTGTQKGSAGPPVELIETYL